MKNGTATPGTPGSLLILTGTCPDGKHTMLECAGCHYGGLERCRYPLYGIMPVIYEADPPVLPSGEGLIYDAKSLQEKEGESDRRT